MGSTFIPLSCPSSLESSDFKTEGGGWNLGRHAFCGTAFGKLGLLYEGTWLSISEEHSTFKSVLILLFFKNPKRPSERVLLNMLMFLNHFELQIVLTVLRIFWLVLLDGRSCGRIFPIGPLSLKELQIKPQLIKCRSIYGLSFFIYLRLSIIKCSYIYCDLLSTWCCKYLGP